MADVRGGRLNIALNKRNTERLDRLSDHYDMSRTATIERALAILDMFEEMDAAGGIYSKEGNTYVRVRVI